MSDRKNSDNEKPSRRTFVRLGMLSGVLVAMGKVIFPGKTAVPIEIKGEKVKMLTSDGKLVEVDKRVIEAATKKGKATNAEIRDFVDHRKNQKS